MAKRTIFNVLTLSPSQFCPQGTSLRNVKLVATKFQHHASCLRAIRPTLVVGSVIIMLLMHRIEECTGTGMFQLSMVVNAPQTSHRRRPCECYMCCVIGPPSSLRSVQKMLLSFRSNVLLFVRKKNNF